MTAKRKWFAPRSNWLESFKRGYRAGAAHRARADVDELATRRYPVAQSYKDTDRAACRIIEGRHVGTDNGIRGGYRRPF